MSGMLINLLVQIVAGAIGGNVVGAAKNLSLEVFLAIQLPAR